MLRSKKIKIIFISSLVLLPLLVCGVLCFVLSTYRPHTMDGVSMQPTLCNGEKFFIKKDSTYKIGDLIVYKHDQSNEYVKRIVGVGGDKIKIEDGKVYRNGTILEEAYLPEDRKTLLASDKLDEGQEYTVPINQYFVLGDNRGNSFDSRSTLAINPKMNTLKGKVVYIIKNSGIVSFDKNERFEESRCVK